MLSRQEEDRERREVLRNDQRIREAREQSPRVFADQSKPNQASTLHQHAVADADTPRGRFSAISAAYVVGSKADIACAYPAASAHQHDPCGPEPPLGYRIDELEPSVLAEAQATDGPADAPSTPLGQRAGPSLSHEPGELGRGVSQPTSAFDPERVPGSPHPFRRF